MFILLLYCLHSPLSLLNSNYLSSCNRFLSFYCLKLLNILWNSKWFSQPPLIYSFYFFNSTSFFLNSNCSFVCDVSNWGQWIWPGFVPMFHVWTIFLRNDLSNIFFNEWKFFNDLSNIFFSDWKLFNDLWNIFSSEWKFFNDLWKESVIELT